MRAPSPCPTDRRRGQLSRRGFTLVELLVSLTIFTLIVGAAFLVMNGSTRSKQVGADLAEAQQNARFALNTIITDLRNAGYGIDTDASIPIEVASDYRLTMVIDEDRDGVVDDGERITYFVDPDQGQNLTSGTANPYDYVLRRVVNSPGDSTAAPGAGVGDVIAYLVTQRTHNAAGSRNVPLFRYFDDTGNILAGSAPDPAGADYGNTLADSLLGLPVGAGNDVAITRVQVRVITETGSPRRGTSNDYRRFDVGSMVRPRNFAFDLLSAFTVIDTTDYAPGDSTGSPDDSTGAPPDSTEDPILPPYEPPIRISTARVLSMDLKDLNELDSQEGSETEDDGQRDLDIILGTKANAVNNLSVWFNGQPDLYSGGRLYLSVPNYFGNSAYDIQDVATGNVDLSGSEYPDVVAAVKVTDTVGGFQVWRNQAFTYPGRIGTGSPTTSPDAYYSAGGQGRAIVLLDFDRDGDLDVAIGTATAVNAGAVELWRNAAGSFTRVDVNNAYGEVNALVVVDFNRDGYPDVAAGTKTSNADKTGDIVILRNSGTGFTAHTTYEAGGKVNGLAVADFNLDGYADLVAGCKTGNNTGTVEIWRGTGAGFLKVDEAAADGPVLCVAAGHVDYGNWFPDVVAGTEKRTVQAWFGDAFNGDDILPQFESWGDANAGGEVHAIAIGKVEVGPGRSYMDPLYDIIAGTAITPTTGEIVIYLNPYVWTLNP